jgi:hypothetical protein
MTALEEKKCSTQFVFAWATGDKTSDPIGFHEMQLQ